MKRFAILAVALLPFVAMSAEEKPAMPTAANAGGKQQVSGEYKYQISVGSQRDENVIRARNQYIEDQTTRNGNRSLGDAILTGLSSSFTQRTVNASSNLVSLGVSLIVEQLEKNSKNFESWSKAKQQQCTYTKDLSSEEQIEDFYYLPSSNGALDPQNMKFSGFTCRNYIEVKSNKGNKQEGAPSATTPAVGHDAFILACSLRTDSLGIAHMVNHSKFMLQVDSLVFYPKYCNIPNVSGRQADESFDFNQFSNLEFQVKVKVTSSWVNEAIMVASDQQLGEFVIHANINCDSLVDGKFFYDGKNPKTLKDVTITGDSFIVPRSFVGTNASPLWGTGQYKLDMEVSESCQLNSSYYKIDGVGNGEAVNFANLPGYKRWDKQIWQTEWKAMNKRKAGSSLLKNTWQAIKTAYVDGNWVKELVDPVATAIYQEETTQLNKLFHLDGSSSSAAMPAASATTTQSPLPK